MQSTAQSLADLFNDARALEKVLKLVQGLVQITASVQRSSIASMGMSTATGSKGVGMSMGSRSRREVEEVVRRWEGARGQIALSRRFFRLFKWVDCWNLAHREYEAGPLYPHLLPSSSSNGSGSVAGRASAKDYTAAAPEGSEQKAWPTANEIRNRLEDETGVMNDSGPAEDTGGKDEGEEPKVQRRASDGDEIYTMLAVLKWSLLGMYFLMEMWTITDAMALTSIWHRFGIDMQEEALKIWVYEIAASIVLGLYELFTTYYPLTAGRGMAGLDGDVKAGDGKLRDEGPGATAVDSRDGDRDRNKNGRHEDSRRSTDRAASEGERRRIVKQLVVDCCDILIPTSAVGWVELDGTYVGMAGAMSAVVSLSGMWRKCATR